MYISLVHVKMKIFVAIVSPAEWETVGSMRCAR